MARIPPTANSAKVHGLRGRRILAVPASEIKPGDRLWSSIRNRPLGVVVVWREQLRADGNLYADSDDPDVPRTEAVCILATDPLTGEQLKLGGFAPRARLQVLRYVPRMS